MKVEEIPDSPPCEVLQDPYQDLQEQADKLIGQLKKEPVEEPLAEIKWEEAVRSNYSNKRINFDMKLYKGMVPTVVKKIPHNVDGLKYFIIDVPEEEAFCTKYRDGRHFELHSSTRNTLINGARRLGRCRGNYICTNTSCAYLLETKKNNQHQFTTTGKNKFCFVQGNIQGEEGSGGNVENQNPIIYPPISNMGRALGLDENPPLLAFLQGFQISLCYGCKSKFAPALKQSPNDLIVKMQVKRDRLVNKKWIPVWKKSWAYFHLALECLKREKSILEIEDIYIPMI